MGDPAMPGKIGAEMTNATTLDIVAMGAQGDGVSADGMFAPLSLPGERILATIEHGRAETIERLRCSDARIEPPCRYFGDCGGCALQHWANEPYLDWKSQQIAQALARVGIETKILPPYAARPGTRRRLALHARRQGPSALVGFKARRSWRTVGIDNCVIADPRLVAALPLLRRLAETFLEHPKSAPTLHVTISETGLDIDVTGVERRSGGLSADARMRAAAIAADGDVARVTLAGEVIYQARPCIVRMGAAIVALPPGAFLQAVAGAERAMAEFIVAAAQGARRIADLYCGVGAFTFPLAAVAPVSAHDIAAPAISALRGAIASAPGLSPIEATTRDLDRRPVLAQDLRKIDVVVFDPPRAGAAAQCGEIARSATPRVVAASCNPTTFARDAKILDRRRLCPRTRAAGGPVPVVGPY